MVWAALSGLRSVVGEPTRGVAPGWRVSRRWRSRVMADIAGSGPSRGLVDGWRWHAPSGVLPHRWRKVFPHVSASLRLGARFFLGRDDSVGSVVLARSAPANPSALGRYGRRTGPRLAHSSACGSICFAITSLPIESSRPSLGGHGMERRRGIARFGDAWNLPGEHGFHGKQRFVREKVRLRGQKRGLERRKPAFHPGKRFGDRQKRVSQAAPCFFGRGKRAVALRNASFLGRECVFGGKMPFRVGMDDTRAGRGTFSRSSRQFCLGWLHPNGRMALRSANTSSWDREGVHSARERGLKRSGSGLRRVWGRGRPRPLRGEGGHEGCLGARPSSAAAGRRRA